MTSKLNAADPTIVEGPSSPAGYPSVLSVSMIDSKISGAELPSAMSVKLAMVAFQIATSCMYVLPSLSTS